MLKLHSAFPPWQCFYRMFTFRQQRAADDRAAVHLILVPSWLNLEWTSCYFLSPRMGGEWWKGPSVSKITLLTELHDQPPTIFLPELKPTCGSHFSQAGNRNEPGKQQICRVFSFHLSMLPNYVTGNINQQQLPWVMALYLRAWIDSVDQSWHFHWRLNPPQHTSYLPTLRCGWKSWTEWHVKIQPRGSVPLDAVHGSSITGRF